jgi:hypothetical protein
MRRKSHFLVGTGRENPVMDNDQERAQPMTLIATGRSEVVGEDMHILIL